ncbi:glycosyltransferase family 9 protein [Candidatus Woesearchaeota archaeon]|nr:glycosyltransferase family 9 protein [Candidatus Woesearchaeota archaeon]
MMYKTKIYYWPFLCVLDIVGYFFFWWLRFIHFKRPGTIAVIRLEQLGDVIMSTPLFRALKSGFPNSKLTVIIRPSCAAALEKNPFVDEVVRIRPPYFSGGGSLKEFFSVFRRRFDLVIEPHGDPRNVLLSFFIGRYVVGFGSRGFGFLLNKRVKDDGRVVSKLLSLAGAVGCSADEKTVWYSFDAAIVKTLPKRYIVIAPETTKVAKEWSVSNWNALAFMLRKYAPVVLTGSGFVSDINTEVNLSGKTNLSQLASVLKNAVLVVSVDSGSAHIAHAVNAPLITLFGPENPDEWGYEDKNSLIVHNKIMAMSPELVLQACEKFLNTS